MLSITIPDVDAFDDETQKFLTLKGADLLLEHSLVSLSKWESLWEKPFLDGKTRTTAETQSYISMMNLAPVHSPEVYERLTNEDVAAIATYIESKQTATWFKPDPDARPSSEIITAEIIYYWMIAHTIPMEAQYWHLERLLTLIKVCNEKNKPAKRSKMATREQADSRRMLNAQRKAQMGTSG